MPGLVSSEFGVSLCCPSGGKVNLCLSLHGRPRKLSPKRIAKALSVIFPKERCLPVVVSRLHRPKPVPKPRCTADDFRCLPVAYSKDMKLRYKRKGRRVPVSHPRTSSGSCRHDGECRVAGCGNHCVAYTVRLLFFSVVICRMKRPYPTIDAVIIELIEKKSRRGGMYSKTLLISL